MKPLLWLLELVFLVLPASFISEANGEETHEPVPITEFHAYQQTEHEAGAHLQDSSHARSEAQRQPSSHGEVTGTVAEGISGPGCLILKSDHDGEFALSGEAIKSLELGKRVTLSFTRVKNDRSPCMEGQPIAVQSVRKAE